MKAEEYLAKDYEIKAPKEGDSLQLYKFIVNSDSYDLDGKIEKSIKLILNLDKKLLLQIPDEIRKIINEFENKFENVCVLNDYLKVKYENGQTKLYINDQYFRKCKYLLLNIPEDDIDQYDDIKSIDDAEDQLSHELHGNSGKRIQYGIDSKQEFIAHCSNLQAWVENDYNTQILHRTMSFPILKELVNAGDPKAKRVYKEEIAYRLEANEMNVVIYLIENGYLTDLTNEELEIILENIKPGIAKIVLQEFVNVNYRSLDRKLPSNFDSKIMAFVIIPDEVYLTSYKRNNFRFKDYKNPFRLKVLDKYSRTLYNDSLVDFGIIWNQQKVLYKKDNIFKALEYFTEKDSILVEIPRSKAPLKLYLKSENLAIYIYPKLMY